jgi:hypothetical protein
VPFASPLDRYHRALHASDVEATTAAFAEDAASTSTSTTATPAYASAIAVARDVARGTGHDGDPAGD